MEQGNSRDRKCSKCSGTMQIGFLADRTYGAVVAAAWVEGVPEKKWIGGVKLADKRAYLLDMWRCASCGYLESYANRTELAE